MGFLNSLFGGAPTKYDAQKYFDYAEKQKAKGNIVEALNYYAKVINHGDLGVKPFVPYIELCVENDEWEKLLACIKVYRKSTHQPILVVHLFVEFRVQLLHNLLTCCLVLTKQPFV